MPEFEVNDVVSREWNGSHVNNKINSFQMSTGLDFEVLFLNFIKIVIKLTRITRYIVRERSNCKRRRNFYYSFNSGHMCFLRFYVILVWFFIYETEIFFDWKKKKERTKKKKKKTSETYRDSHIGFYFWSTTLNQSTVDIKISRNRLYLHKVSLWVCKRNFIFKDRRRVNAKVCMCLCVSKTS